MKKVEIDNIKSAILRLTFGTVHIIGTGSAKSIIDLLFPDEKLTKSVTKKRK